MRNRDEKRAEMRLAAINRQIDMLSCLAHNDGLSEEEMRAEAERIVDNSACMNCYDAGCMHCLPEDEV